MLHLHIKKATVSHSPLDGMRMDWGRCCPDDSGRMKDDESKSLTAYISQIRLGEPVFQTSHHMVDILVAFPQIQAVESFQILSNLIHIRNAWS